MFKGLLPGYSAYKKNRFFFYRSKKSQTFSDKYYDTGNFGIFSKNVFYKNHKIKFSGFVIERSKSVDIDTIEDWNLALILSK